LGRRARLARPRARRRAGVREGERRGARGAARRALRGGRLWVHLGRAAHLRRVDRAGPRTRTRGPGGFEAEARPRGPTSMIQALAIGVPPSSHFIYIPGIVIGFVLGAKATRDAIALEARKAAEREERKARRQAGAAAGANAAASTSAETPK